MEDVRPSAVPHPFDVQRSSRIDRIVLALEAEPQPSAPRRFWLRLQKRHLERGIPPALKAVDAVRSAMTPCRACDVAMGYPSIDGDALCESCRNGGLR